MVILRATGRWDFQPSNDFGIAARRAVGRLRISVFAPLLVAVSLMASASAVAQTPGIPRQAAAHAVVNFAELARQEAANPPASSIPGPRVPRVAPFLTVPGDRPVPPEFVRQQKPAAPEAALGLPSAAIASPSPLESFEALRDQDVSIPPFVYSFIPPDTMGAAGPNHLMVTLNSQVRIQDRAGGVLSTVSLESFWAGTGATSTFDPKVVYDPFGGRWIVTAMSDGSSAASSVLIGASQSSDPTGLWNLYRLDADAGNTNWADYPSLGFNKDWVVVSANLFPNAGGVFQSAQVYVFEKADLYAGVAPGSLSTTLFADPNSGPTPAFTYDNALATMYLVRHWNGNSGGSGFLRISTITGSVGAEVYTAGGPFVSTANPWGFQPSGGVDFAPQQGTNDKIQNNDARIQNVVYRNGSIWATQNAFLPAVSPTHTAAQWWQFTSAGAVQQFGRVEDTNALIFYAFPSIAVNSQNDALLGFSSFSASQFASASYAFRFAADAANTMRDPVLLKAGEATYFKTFSGTDNRWGDYSATVVDPVNDLDFWTIQEYARPHDTADRWGTWWGKVSPTAVRRRGQLVGD